VYVSCKKRYSTYWTFPFYLFLLSSSSASVAAASILCLKKTSPTFLTVTWKPISKFWQFLVQIFLTQLAIKKPFSFPPHLTFVSALPWENKTSEMSLFYPMRYDCLINITHKNTFFYISDTLADISFSCLFLTACSKLLDALVHYANTGKETLSPFINSSIDKVLLQSNPGRTSRFLTSQTFINFTW